MRPKRTLAADPALCQLGRARSGLVKRLVQPASGNCSIKGNRNRKGQWIYHVPGMPYYDRIRPEEIFCTEAEARAAGQTVAAFDPLRRQRGFSSASQNSRSAFSMASSRASKVELRSTGQARAIDCPTP